jgi:hypothetical protein
VCVCLLPQATGLFVFVNLCVRNLLADLFFLNVCLCVESKDGFIFLNVGVCVCGFPPANFFVLCMCV